MSIAELPSRLRAGKKSLRSLILLLQNGDRLTREEFERRYDAMPHLKNAELIEGVVYLPSSPVSNDNHGAPHADMMMPLAALSSVHSRRARGRQLDGSSRSRQRRSAGRSTSSRSTAARSRLRTGTSWGDRNWPPRWPSARPATTWGPSCRSIAATPCRDPVLRVFDEALDWFILRGSQYERLEPSKGIHKSEVFPGLWLDAASLLSGDLARVHEVLQQGLASKQHKKFVAQLQGAKT